MDQLVLKAFAKINIGLDVLKRREDGYHEVRMIMQTISLHDTVTLEKIDKKGIFLTTDSQELPVPEENLAYRAAELLMREFPQEQGVLIGIKKRIPIAAGLAGGSTDAAAVLRGINQLFDLKLSTQELMQRGVKLGADVPYCIVGGTMLAEGIGEQLSELPSMPECYVLIAKPDIAVSTKWVYENLNIRDTNQTDIDGQINHEQKRHPDIQAQIRGLQNQSLKEITASMGNILEDVTKTEYPVIESIEHAILQVNALQAMMSGSGPTVFGIFEAREQLETAYDRLKGTNGIRDIFKTTVVEGY